MQKLERKKGQPKIETDKMPTKKKVRTKWLSEKCESLSEKLKSRDASASKKRVLGASVFHLTFSKSEGDPVFRLLVSLNPSERNHKYSWSLHIYYLPFYWLEMLIFFCKVNSKNIIVMVSCTEEVDHCKHNMIHHLNHAPEKGKVENHYSTCGRIIYSKIFKMNDKWCNRTTKLFPIKHS